MLLKTALILSLVLNIGFSWKFYQYNGSSPDSEISEEKIYNICEPGIPIGAPIPEYSAENLQGGDLSLQDIQGKKALVTFFAEWCTPCLEEIPELVKLRKKIPDEDLEIIGINVDSEDQINKTQAMKEKFGINYTLLIDSFESVKSKLFVNGLPANLLLNSDGTLIISKTGYSEGTVPELEKLILSRDSK